MLQTQLINCRLLKKSRFKRNHRKSKYHRNKKAINQEKSVLEKELSLLRLITLMSTYKPRFMQDQAKTSTKYR